MTRSNAVRPIFWLATMFAIVFLVRAESGDKRASALPQKERAAAPITILDQNGQPAMRAYTGDMICGLRQHIRFLSSILTLRPGDLITTGTPAGVKRLAAGDRLRGRIEKIGEMELRVAAEDRAGRA